MVIIHSCGVLPSGMNHHSGETGPNSLAGRSILFKIILGSLHQIINHVLLIYFNKKYMLNYVHGFHIASIPNHFRSHIIQYTHNFMTEKVIIILLNMHSLIDSSVLVLRLLHLKIVDVGLTPELTSAMGYSDITTRSRYSRYIIGEIKICVQ
jgi:hypothetical protein